MDSVVKAGGAFRPKMLELEGLCTLYGVNGFAGSANIDVLLCKLAIIEVGIPKGCSRDRICMVMNLSSSLALTWGLGDIRILEDTGLPAVNGGTKVPISGCVTVATVVETVAGAVTPISVETGIARVVPMGVDAVAPNVGADPCVDYACEEYCDDYDDAKVPLLVGRAIIFKAFPLLKCMHRHVFFQ